MLQVKGVHKYFRGVHALNNVNFNLEQATVLALVGDNGAGKSTLMKCVSGVLNPDSGSIHFNDHDISKGSPNLCHQAGIEMIYQDLSLCKLQDVVSNVFLGREDKKGLFLNRASMHAKCAEAFAKLGIEIPLNSVVEHLSGGQQQSIAIARAMLSNPNLLILDEPTAALAVKETRMVFDHIIALKEAKVSVIMITHRLEDVFQVADRILVMRQGCIKHDLTPQETDLRDLTCKILG